MSDEQIKNHLKQSIIEFGGSIENNQYSIVKHRDTDIDHYHVVLNKVDFNGKNINTSYCQKKAHAIADKIEKENNLVPTIGRTIFYDESQKLGFRYATPEEKKAIAQAKPKGIKPISDKRDGVKDRKQFMQDKLVEITKNTNCKSMIDLEYMLSDNGINTRFTTNSKTNEVHGFSVSVGGYSCSGTELGVKWGDVEQHLTANLEQYQKSIEVAPLKAQHEQLEIHLNRLSDNADKINNTIITAKTELLDVNESIKLGVKPAKPLSKIDNEIRNHECLLGINQKEIDKTLVEIKAVETKVEEQKIIPIIKPDLAEPINLKTEEVILSAPIEPPVEKTVKAAAPATQVQQDTDVKKLISIEKYADSIKDLPLKRQKELWVKHATIIEGKQVETKAILADTTISEGKRQQLNERLNDYIVLEPKIKAYYKAVNDKILLEEVAVKPIAKQAEMENQIIILERKLVEIKQYAEKVEKENPNDFKALREVTIMKIKANRELLNARDELAEYKDKVEHLQEQNEDLTILQIDKIIKEQEEKGEQRGNSTSMSR